MPGYPLKYLSIRTAAKPVTGDASAGHRPPLPASLMIVVFIGLALMLLKTQSVIAGNFEPPGLDGYTMHSEHDADGDGDGVNETRIKQYLNQEGDSLVSMSSKGRLWAWSLNTNNNNSAVQNYVIRDSDCDGTFDEVYSLDDDFHVPECVK